ncbi:MAG: hypothetical protein ACI379_13820 [Nocardioides sp.]|uniref:hypothetical protein n=1 Tax=Nocardioides sp. TaxID=35761 RepID=UPI003F03A5F6
MEIEGPLVPARNGPRALAGVYALATALLLAIAGGFLFYGTAADVADLFGGEYGRDVTATVTDMELHLRSGKNCERYHFTATYDGGTATFRQCVHEELAGLEVGDPVELHTLPGTTEVVLAAEHSTYDRVGGLVMVGLLLLGAWRCGLMVVRCWRLSSRGARVPVGPMRVTSYQRATVRATEVDAPSRTWVFLLAVPTDQLPPGRRFDVWAARHSFSLRPAGPWALHAVGAEPVLATHGWPSRRRGWLRLRTRTQD